MIDKLPPIIETSDSGASKYLSLAIGLLHAAEAEAVAVVVINGKFGNGGTAAARNHVALAALPAVMREVAGFQEQQAKDWLQKEAIEENRRRRDVPR